MYTDGYDPEEHEVRTFLRQMKKNNMVYQNEKKKTKQAKTEVT